MSKYQHHPESDLGIMSFERFSWGGVPWSGLGGVPKMSQSRVCYGVVTGAILELLNWLIAESIC